MAQGHFFNILHGGVLAGGVCMVFDGEQSVDIKYLYLGTAFQDKHIGSSVIGLIEAHYEQANHWSLLTPSKAYRNHHFYEKFGFVKINEFQPDPTDDFSVFEYVKEERFLTSE
ncbi:GNAT family N-acetyltransferase [Photobacterium nomapromontoriensis]